MKTRLSLLPGLGLALTVVSASAAQGTINPTTALPEGQAPIQSSQPAVPTPAERIIDASAASGSVVPARPQEPALASQHTFSNTYVSPWFSEVVKLARAGVGDEVLRWYIHSAGTFELGSDQIIYLRDLGVSDQIISTMIRHDLEFASGALPLSVPTAPLPGPKVDFPTLAGSDSAGATTVGLSPGPFGDSTGIIAPLTSATATESPIFEVPEPIQAPAQETGLATRLGILYPVREPYPVELTKPILLVRCAGPTPNLVVIDMLQ